MVHVKKNYTTKSQLHALATHTPILGHVSQGAWGCGFPQLAGSLCLVILAFVHVSSKKRWQAHTISTKLIQKYLHRRKSEKVMMATNMCSNFGGFRCSPPLIRIFNLVVNGCHCVMIVLYHELHKKTYTTNRKETLRDTLPPLLIFNFNTPLPSFLVLSCFIYKNVSHIMCLMAYFI